MDDASYNHYALSKPRPYSLIVFMTAAHPKFKCAICKQLDSEVSLVSQSFAKQYTPSGMNVSQEMTNDLQNNVFFVRLDYEQAQKTFQSYGLNSVPIIFHIPSYITADRRAEDETASSGSGNALTISVRDRFQFSSIPDAESIAGFVRERAHVDIKITRSAWGTYILLFVVLAILAALVRPVINNIAFWLQIIRRKSIWIVISAAVYTCAISGLIFDIIRLPPM